MHGLKEWFIAKKRDLPWRKTTDPYFIWISEVMLQQTQVNVVIPYFQKWINRFPTIKDLAQASLEEVLKAWEGLGYYSRARHLHEGAKYLVNKFDGIIPDDGAQLKTIKGLGPYTIGAILSFAFHQKKTAVDGNVLRVVSRYFALEENICKPAVVKKIDQLVFNLLPDEESWIINEALIELGATICTRKPQCCICPLQVDCQAFIQGRVNDLPVKSKALSKQLLFRAVPIIRHGSDLLVKKGAKGKVMSDLYEFPYFEISEEGISALQLEKVINHHYGINALFQQKLPEVVHSFTRYQARLYPFLYVVNEKNAFEDHEWLSKDKLKTLAFSAGHRRIFLYLQPI